MAWFLAPLVRADRNRDTGLTHHGEGEGEPQMKFYEIERIKKMIGLPPEAGNREIEARIADLMAKEGPRKLPPEEKPEVPPQEKSSLVSEMSKMEFEPLLSVEKKLIAWSIGLGIVGLGFLVWVSYTFFPAGH
jgi:hypothetical protein